MNQDYIKPDNWSIIDEGFDADQSKIVWKFIQYRKRCYGTTCQFWRILFWWKHSKEAILPEFIIPIKLKWVGGKMAIPEYFAKVLNAPNWIGIDIEINDEWSFGFSKMQIDCWRITVNANWIWKKEFISRSFNCYIAKRN